MFWNKSDHKKYGFVLVLYLFRDISSFKSEKGDNTKLSHTSFIYKQKRFILKRNAKLLEFCSTYQSDQNAIIF